METAAFVGQVVGLGLNVLMQYFVWRYLLVYYNLKGEKAKYEERKAAYQFLSVLIALIVFPIVYWMSSIWLPLVGLIFIAFIFYSIRLSSMWKQNEILPDPFRSKPNKAVGEQELDRNVTQSEPVSDSSSASETSKSSSAVVSPSDGVVAQLDRDFELPPSESPVPVDIEIHKGADESKLHLQRKAPKSNDSDGFGSRNEFVEHAFRIREIEAELPDEIPAGYLNTDQMESNLNYAARTNTHSLIPMLLDRIGSTPGHRTVETLYFWIKKFDSAIANEYLFPRVLTEGPPGEVVCDYVKEDQMLPIVELRKLASSGKYEHKKRVLKLFTKSPKNLNEITPEGLRKFAEAIKSPPHLQPELDVSSHLWVCSCGKGNRNAQFCKSCGLAKTEKKYHKIDYELDVVKQDALLMAKAIERATREGF